MRRSLGRLSVNFHRDNFSDPSERGSLSMYRLPPIPLIEFNICKRINNGSKEIVL